MPGLKIGDAGKPIRAWEERQPRRERRSLCRCITSFGGQGGFIVSGKESAMSVVRRAVTVSGALIVFFTFLIDESRLEKYKTLAESITHARDRFALAKSIQETNLGIEGMHYDLARFIAAFAIYQPSKGEEMSKQVIHELAIATQQGKMTFPQVVKGLLEAGVESYLVDFAAKQKTHYLVDGSTHTVPMILDPGPIAAEFDSADLVAAINVTELNA
jgi:hypothetical protein